MKLNNYKQFKGVSSVNENLDRAKKLVKQRALIQKAASGLGFIDDDLAYQMKEGEIKTLTLDNFSEEQQQQLKMKLRDLKLDPRELKSAEGSEEFIKLKELFSKNIGYMYNFTYMYYIENVPFEEIEGMFKDLIEVKDLLQMLPSFSDIGKKFDANFIDSKIPNEKEHRTNSEILVEGIEKLKEYRKVKKILDTLPKELKKAYKDAPELDKEGLAEVAVSFEEVPNTPTKDKDSSGNYITKRERIWKNFFGEMKKDSDRTRLDGQPNPRFGKLVYMSRLKRFEGFPNPIKELVKAAKDHINASMSDGYNDFFDKINKCNDQYGILGVDIVYNSNSIMILNIKSYQANKFLNSDSNHCIVNYQSYWDSYTGDYNKQYYIYNFNIPSTDDLSSIGVTITPERGWRSGGACQSKRNSYIGGQFKDILKGWEKEYNIEDDLFMMLEPMSDEEIQKRKRAKVAEKDIVKKGLSIDLVKQYVTEDGANINKDEARALLNSVEEDDFEKTKLCLELGANPNLSSNADAMPISKAKSLKMIELLVSYGSNMTGHVFNNIVDNVDALEYCLKAGLNPEFNNLMPFRITSKGSWKTMANIGNSYLDAFKLLYKYNKNKIGGIDSREVAVKYAAEYSRFDILDFLDEQNYYNENNVDWVAAKHWISHSRRITDDDKTKIISYLDVKEKIYPTK